MQASFPSDPASLDDALDAAELSDDTLAGSLRVYQRRRGHRYSLDDVVTAWVAARSRPAAERALDLGCGLGSVLLMLAYKLPEARIWGIEAQAQSFALCGRNVERNGVGARVNLTHGDLRQQNLGARLGAGSFDLISATPPYKKPHEGTLPPDSQKAHARFELRGGVEDYLKAAAPLLAPSGRLVICAEASQPERVLATAPGLGLCALKELRVLPAAHYKRPLFTVWTLGPCDGGAPSPGCVREADFVARDHQGRRTAAARQLRLFFGLDAAEGEPDSPRLRARRPGSKGGEGDGVVR